MKARLPQGYGKGSGNLAGMMKQAQKMQEDMTARKPSLKQPNMRQPSAAVQ